jgi:hypothetical protein
MDIIKKYKKQKKMTNFTIVAISFVIALWVNFFVLDNTNISNSLKTSLLESEKKQNIWDLYLESNWNNILLKTKNSLNNISNITLSIAYNSENINIKDIIPKLHWEISNISNTDGLTTIILEYSEINNIEPNEKILTISTEKKKEKTENINIISANYTDKSGKSFELFNSWIIY